MSYPLPPSHHPLHGGGSLPPPPLPLPPPPTPHFPLGLPSPFAVAAGVSQQRLPPPPIPMAIQHSLSAVAAAHERLEQAARQQAERNAKFGAPISLPVPPPPSASAGRASLPPPPFPLPLPPPPPPSSRGSLPLPPMPPSRASLPLPPIPTATTASQPIAIGVWRIYRTPPPENTEYYFNSLTQKTQWTKPDELKTDEERMFPPSPWQEYKNETGDTYYANSVTQESSWTKPQELIDYETAKAQREAEAKRKSSTVVPAADVEQKLRENQAKVKKEKKKKAAAAVAVAAETTSTVAPTPITPAPTPIVDEPIYATKEEARAAFRSLLIDKKVSSKMKNFNVDVLPLISGDVRYKALKTLPERKKAYLNYMEEVVSLENEARQKREGEVLKSFQLQLQETVEINYKSKFKTMLPILELDERYQALYGHLLNERITSGTTSILSVNTAAVQTRIEDEFNKYISELKEKAFQEREKLLKGARLQFQRMLKEQTTIDAMTSPKSSKRSSKQETKDEGEIEEGEEMDETNGLISDVPKWIDSKASFKEFKKRNPTLFISKDHPDDDGDTEMTTQDDSLSSLTDAMKEDLFDEWLDELERIQREKDVIKKEQRRKIEKEKKREFEKLLADESAKLRLHGRTKWKDFIPLIKEDERYQQLMDFYLDGKSPSRDSIEKYHERMEDLFLDFQDDLLDRLEPIKKKLKNIILKDLNLTIQLNHSIEQLNQACSKHEGWSLFLESLDSPSDLSLIWLDLIAKVQTKIQYFHSKQKNESIKAVCKLLRSLYTERKSTVPSDELSVDELLSDARQLTFEQCREMVEQLKQPIIVGTTTTTPKPELEEGEEEEDGELKDDSLPITPISTPIILPRHHPPQIQTGLDAWDLLEHPPLPPPTTAPAGTTFTTDEYLREAVLAFKLQLQTEIESSEKKRVERETKKRKAASESSTTTTINPDEFMTPSETVDATNSTSPSTTRKRHRSVSRSTSRSPTRSPRSRSSSPDDKDDRPSKRSKVKHQPSTSTIRTDDEEEGELD